ncbi:MAG: ABC transporter permease family protein, partial [Planctomycetota bacterium]
MKQISLLLCLRYLQHRRIVLLSMAAVMLSCALLIVTDSLFTGFIDAVENSFCPYRGDVIFETPPGKTLAGYDEFIDRLCGADCIESATAVLSSQGLLLSAPGKVKAAGVWGIEPNRVLTVTPLNDVLLFQEDDGDSTQPDEITDEYNIEAVKGMLGKPMAMTTGSVIQNQQNTDGSQARFSRKVIKFKLANVVRTGINDFDESLVLLPIDVLSAQLYPEKETSANILHIRLAEGADEEKAMAIIWGLWRNFAENRFSWSGLAKIELTRELNARMIAEYKKQMNVLLLIFGLVSIGIILLVFCIFYLIVMTRRKDIGILKSCGVSSPS